RRLILVDNPSTRRFVVLPRQPQRLLATLEKAHWSAREAPWSDLSVARSFLPGALRLPGLGHNRRTQPSDHSERRPVTGKGSVPSVIARCRARRILGVMRARLDRSSEFLLWIACAEIPAARVPSATSPVTSLCRP